MEAEEGDEWRPRKVQDSNHQSPALLPKEATPESTEHTARGLPLQILLSREPHGTSQAQASASTTVWAAVGCDCPHLPELDFLGQQFLYARTARTEHQEARALAWEE